MPAHNSATKVHRNSQLSMIQKDKVPKTNIEPMANIFPFLEMQRSFSHCVIVGPNSLLLHKRWCHWGDDFAKHHAASKTKHVVGSNGRKAPNMPSPRASKPAAL